MLNANIPSSPFELGIPHFYSIVLKVPLLKDCSSLFEQIHAGDLEVSHPLWSLEGIILFSMLYNIAEKERNYLVKLWEQLVLMFCRILWRQHLFIHFKWKRRCEKCFPVVLWRSVITTRLPLFDIQYSSRELIRETN